MADPDMTSRRDDGANLSASLFTGAPDRESSIMDELCRLIAAGRQFASAELAYQAARARLMGKAAVWIAAGGALALALMFFVLMALVVGLLLALAPALGPWGALATVVGGLLVATALAGLAAWLGIRKFMALLHDGKDAAA